jgi:hypothetical protein
MNDRLPQLTPGMKRLSLLEAIVILLVFTIIVSSSAVLVSGQRVERNWRITEWRMQRIEQLLQMHLAAFGRLPCPSDIARGEGDPLFGVEAANAGRCTGQMPSANAEDAGGERVMGGVPFATLGLSEEATLDGWGRRIVYYVASGWTAGMAQPSPGMGGGAFQLRDLNDQILEPRAVWVLWSAGADGHGAYPVEGGHARERAQYVSEWQLENCDCDAQARSTGMNALFYVRGNVPESSSDAVQLDDVVRGASGMGLMRGVLGGGGPP